MTKGDQLLAEIVAILESEGFTDARAIVVRRDCPGEQSEPWDWIDKARAYLKGNHDEG